MLRHAPSDEHREQYRRWVRSLRDVGLTIIERTDVGPLIETTYEAWYGVVSMPKINLSNPETRAYFLDVAQYWLREFDIDGWRMDVARHVVPDFWPEFRRATKAVKPDCYLLAEIWGDTSAWLQGDMFDATMNYFFRDLCVDYFARDAMSTGDFLDRITRMLAMYAPQATAVNHNLFSSHDTERFLHMAGEDPRRLRLATLFQLTIPGAPGIYYGDEISMTGGFDPDCRRAFPWDRPKTWDRETLEMVRALTRLRKAYPALRYGEWRPVWSVGDAFAFVREAPTGERVLVAINRGDAAVIVEALVPTSRPEILWGTVTAAADGATLTLRDLGPWSGAVVRL
jgi:glycosidase